MHKTYEQNTNLLLEIIIFINYKAITSPLNQIQNKVIESGAVDRALEYHTKDRGFAPIEERFFLFFLLKFKYFEDGSKKATEASALSRRQKREEKEREAGDQQPVNDFETEPEAKDHDEEPVEQKDREAGDQEPVNDFDTGSEDQDHKDEPVEEPGQEPVAFGRLELDQELAEKD
ncbi:hypothetical protein DAPPUDRAFT_323687 [Daphnia pulex]|uniref:Uncharacterized protein n=1 Tax=Daphnia pulex TaxID=6669 RepID=E9GZG6_DAPPU|nr:hypothetical protein DAPPUDRAFT_323687 [Daphnia pulex]|eukprot:EFX75145.1 hypothetical protein DAPPUDRAFT_323687 [Daphnia pulex]